MQIEWRQIPETASETWLTDDDSGTYAQVAFIDDSIGWNCLVRVWINEHTEVFFHGVEFYQTREQAQAWCEQWLRGETVVRFFPHSESARGAHAPA